MWTSHGEKSELYAGCLSTHGKPTRGCPPAWEFGGMLTTPHRKSVSCYEIFMQTALDLDWYFSETWSLTLREECSLRVFENRVLRRIFGPKRDELTGVWRKLHNEELYDLYSSPNITWVIKSRRMRWFGRVEWVGYRRGAYRVLVGKLEGKRPLGRPRLR